MCYDIKTQMRAALKRARRIGDFQEAQWIESALRQYEGQEFYHVSGFEHPSLIGYTNKAPFEPQVLQWGLIPSWVKDRKQAEKLWNTTLNARGETIFEKPSFRTAAKFKRCVIYLDGFYEHHHRNGKTYPHLIRMKDREPFAVAGLWENWKDPATGEELRTFAIVTTEANELMARIHNNPKLEEGPRMPVILPDEAVDQWLLPDEKHIEEQIKELIKPYPAEAMEAHTVGRIRGKDALGNVPGVCEEHLYPELVL
jgi:putative SOS response-associated peptidase YedK